MAKRTIAVRINLSELKKEWLFAGEKGIYLDATILQNDEPDQYGNNGMILQQVPKTIREAENHLPKEQRTRGPILGNCKVFAPAANESTPGTALPSFDPNHDDDLPF